MDKHNVREDKPMMIVASNGLVVATTRITGGTRDAKILKD